MWVEAISKRTGVPVQALWKIANSASRRYYRFEIKKADGSPRVIDHPSKVLKSLQRLIVRNIISHAPVHHCATAYKKGSSISQNAKQHANLDLTTRLDFSNFFPSFDKPSVKNFMARTCDKAGIAIDENDVEFMAKILCKNDNIVIGAPSSPKITNAMMFDFDEHVESICKNHNVVYTRYADDLYISSNSKKDLQTAESVIKLYVQGLDAPKLQINEAKTLHLSRASHRSVTGLVITPEKKVSIGRSRKREIKTLTFLALNDKIDDDKKRRLMGLLAFAYDNEPDFIDALSNKFGENIELWFKSI